MAEFNVVNIATPDGNTDDVLEIKNSSSENYRLADVISMAGEYTFSVWAKADESVSVEFRILGNSYTETITTDWKKLVYTVDESKTTYIDICPGGDSALYFYKAMLQQGQFDTDWKPAPEDTDARIDDAAKVATNYMNFSDVGLVIGDMTADTLGNNVLIDADSIDIRNGDAVLASYTADTIYLGQNSTQSVINLCNGTATLKNINSDPDTDWHRLLIKSEDSIGLNTAREVTIDVDYDSGDGTSSSGVFRLVTDSPWFDFDRPVLYSGGHFELGIDNSWSNNETSSSACISADKESISLSYETTINDERTSCSISLNDGISLTADSGISAYSPVYCHQKLVMDNDVPIYARDTGNTDIQILTMSTSNNTVLGYGGYSEGIGRTNIYGTDIWFKAKNAGDTGYYPYYKKGDSITVSWYGAGFLTNSKTDVCFSIPLSKPIIGSPTVTVTSSSGLILRQESAYTHGSSSSTYVIPSSYSTAAATENYVRITAKMSDTTNAVNNSPIGITASIKITFS